MTTFRFQNWLLIFPVVAASLCVGVRPGSAYGTDGSESIVHGLVHLRSGDTREWSTFPENAQARELAIPFESMANAEECTLRLRQQDVKQSWRISINEIDLGELVRDENDQVNCVPVPAGTLRDGVNTFSIHPPPQGDASDDVRVGDITLIRAPMSTALDECRVGIQVIDADTGEAIPARITILDADGVLHPAVVETDTLLAVRNGVIYTGTGEAEFGLPVGRYTIHAGRGFEYSLATVEIDLTAGETLWHALEIRREVPTVGYVACDTHVHTLTFSGHGDASLEERLVTLAAEGIELPIATDHNIHIDYERPSREAGLRRYFTPVIGNEVTTPVGHFNIFPLLADSRVPHHEHSHWQSVFDEIFATPGVRLAVLNHARDVHSGVRPFGPDHFNAASGESLDGWPYRMQAMEVVNSAAIQTNVLQLFQDWMTLLNAGYAVTPIGASDSHDVARHFVGQARTYVRCDDTDPGNIDVQAAIDSVEQGRVMVAYGLLAELTIDGQYSSGDTVTVMQDEVNVHVRVLGPPWTRADEVQLYANGEMIESRRVDNSFTGGPHGVKGVFDFVLPRPRHDQYLVAIALGPGVSKLYWPTARPYQPTSTEWVPHVVGCSGAVQLDADGDPGFSPARDYATRIWAQADRDLPRLVELLSEYDAATAAQAAALYQADGGNVTSDEFRSAMTAGPESVQTGFQRYFHAWRACEQARLEQ